MPLFTLTFHYDGRHDPVVCGRAEIEADTWEAAARHAARARGVSSVFVRTVNGEDVGRSVSVLPPLPYGV